MSPKHAGTLGSRSLHTDSEVSQIAVGRRQVCVDSGWVGGVRAGTNLERSQLRCPNTT